MGRPDPAGGRQLPGQRPAHRAVADLGPGHRQGLGGRRERSPEGAPRRRRGGRPRCGRRGGGGRLGRPLPRRRVPDRVGHVVEHERQRGDRGAGVGAARAAGAPQRRGQRLAVVERRVPDGHPPRRHPEHLGRAGAGPRTPGQGAPPPAAPVQGRREGRPHAPHGRHPRDARPGVRRVRRADRARDRADAGHVAARRRAAPGRDGRGHRHQRAEGLRPWCHRQDRDRSRSAAHRGARPLRGPGRP